MNKIPVRLESPVQTAANHDKESCPNLCVPRSKEVLRRCDIEILEQMVSLSDENKTFVCLNLRLVRSNLDQA